MADIVDFGKWKKNKEEATQRRTEAANRSKADDLGNSTNYERPTLGRLRDLSTVDKMRKHLIDWLQARERQSPHPSSQITINAMSNGVMSPREKWSALDKIFDVDYHGALASAFVLAKEDSSLREDVNFNQVVKKIWERSMIHIADLGYGAGNLKFMEDITADLATVLSGFSPGQFDAQVKRSRGQMLIPANTSVDDHFRQANEKIQEDWRLATVGPQTYDESAAGQKANREAPPKAFQIIQAFAKSHPEVDAKFNEDLQMLIASFNGNHMGDPKRKAFIRLHRRNDVLEGRLSTEQYMFANALAYLGQEGLAEAKKYMRGLDVDPGLTLAEWGAKHPKE